MRKVGANSKEVGSKLSGCKLNLGAKPAYGTLRNETKRNGTLRNGTLRNGTLRNGTILNGANKH